MATEHGTIMLTKTICKTVGGEKRIKPLTPKPAKTGLEGIMVLVPLVMPNEHDRINWATQKT